MKPPPLPNARATQAIVAACGLVFLIQTGFGSSFNAFLEAYFGLSGHGLAMGEFWQLITYQFLHGNVLHLFVNMAGLWFAGREVEYRFGRLRFLILYFAGGVLGGLLQLALTPNPEIPLIGASASVCAVVVAFTAIYANLPVTALIFFVVPVQLKAKYLGYLVIGTSLALGITGLWPGVGHYAHLGGGLTGLVAAGFWSNIRDFFPRFSFLRRRADPDGWNVLSPEKANLDAILNKVLRRGLHSLSPEEMAELEQWDRSRRRPRGK